MHSLSVTLVRWISPRVETLSVVVRTAYNASHVSVHETACWVREQGTILQPSGYEPDELPIATIPHCAGKFPAFLKVQSV